MPRDDVDDAIATLNPGDRRRKDSGDSLNFRDTGFDTGAGGHKRGDSGTLIQPIAAESGYMGGQMDDTASPREAAGAFLDDEEKEAEEMRRREEATKKQRESPYKEFYRDPSGNYYDPTKKFGII